MSKRFSVGLLAFSALMLAGCGTGSGTTGGTPGPTPTPPGTNPSIVDPATDGPTVSADLKRAKLFNVSPKNTSRMLFNAGQNKTVVGNGGISSVQQNLSGGYDFSILGQRNRPGTLISMGYADKKSTGDAWEKTLKDPTGKTLYSVALWNAGKGGLDGLVSDQNGQTFHKIVGYYLSDNTTQNRERGHIVFGNKTDNLTLETKTRTATYDGYFYSNISPSTGTPPDQMMAVSGGIKMVADFDNNLLSGNSTNMQIRQAGASTFSPQTYTLTFKPTAIVPAATAGAVPDVFSGVLESDYLYLNGTYEGNFFGGNAQEIGGVLYGTNGNGMTEGYFTAVVEP